MMPPCRPLYTLPANPFPEPVSRTRFPAPNGVSMVFQFSSHWLFVIEKNGSDFSTAYLWLQVSYYADNTHCTLWLPVRNLPEITGMTRVDY